MKGILAEIEKQCPNKPGKVNTADIEMKRKRLLAKKERYQEMYANDVMTMTELKSKTSSIAEELKELDYSLEQYEQSLAIQQNGESLIEFYMQEIERFLNLETVTNLDLRKIIDHIVVDKDGNVKIVLKKITDLSVL